MTAEIYQKITDALVDGQELTALQLVRVAVEQGLAPVDIITSGLQPGLDILGEEYAVGSCFVPELIIAGRTMQAAMRILGKQIQESDISKPLLGKVVIGTVAGDVHTIGKDLVGALLSMNGFEVIDMGFNVPEAAFVRTVQKQEASILALSALLTTTKYAQETTIQALQRAGTRDQVKVIIGGASTSQDWADQIGADGYAANATQAVTVCRHLLELQQ